MTDYSSQIKQIENATSLEDIQKIVRQFSAQASGEEGILYSGKVGEIEASKIALQKAEHFHRPVINNTP